MRTSALNGFRTTNLKNSFFKVASNWNLENRGDYQHWEYVVLLTMFFHNATSVSEKPEDEVDVTGRYPGNKSWWV